MAQEPCYVLPVAVLLETMSGLHATVTLHAHLAALPEVGNEACLAELTLVQGQARHCRISTLQGQVLLQQAAAFHRLAQLGELEWRLQPSQPDEPHEATQSPYAGSWQVAVPLSAVRASLSQREKQVLLLIESQHDPEQMARLLRLSRSQIEQLVEALATRHLIKQTQERRNG